MPKIERYPTPTQAQVIDWLAGNRGLKILWNMRSSATWTGINRFDAERATGAIRASTMRKMIREGWLTQVESGSPHYELSERGEEISRGLQEEDLRSNGSARSVSAQDILRAIRSEYPRPHFVVADEVHVPGYNTRIDALAFCIEPSADVVKVGSWSSYTKRESSYLNRTAFEIKVSRQDFKREIEQPSKRLGAMELSHRFYFATPVNLIAFEDLPEDCGLVEVDDHGNLSYAVSAPRLPGSQRPSWAQAAALMRSILKA